MAVARAAPAKWHCDLIFVETADTSFGLAARQFKTLVEARTHGQMSITLRPNGQWNGQTLDEPQIVSAVVGGQPQMALVTTGPLSNYSPELEVLNYPFLFKNYAQVDRVLDGPIGERLLAALPARGLHGLCFMDGGFRIVTASRPLQHLSDFHNLRVRSLPSRTYVNLLKALQAIPVPSSIDKIYAMAQRGYIEAADRSYPTYWSLKLYDVFKFITETNHAYSPKVLIVNQALFASLPADVQAALGGAAVQTRLGQRHAFRAEVAAVKKHAAEHGVRIITLSATDAADLEVASRPVQEQVTRIVGRQLVDQIRAQR